MNNIPSRVLEGFQRLMLRLFMNVLSVTLLALVFVALGSWFLCRCARLCKTSFPSSKTGGSSFFEF